MDPTALRFIGRGQIIAGRTGGIDTVGGGGRSRSADRAIEEIEESVWAKRKIERPE